MSEVIELESIPTKIKYKGFIWVRELKEDVPSKTNNNINKIDTVDNNFTIPTEKPKRGNAKRPYIIRWIEKKDVGDVFTLDQFYRLYPKLEKDHVGHKRVDKIIINLVQEGKINHWKHKDQFRVGK